jgi:exopolysaccharide/PEP-CTERM locus tyrosine autokinase
MDLIHRAVQQSNAARRESPEAGPAREPAAVAEPFTPDSFAAPRLAPVGRPALPYKEVRIDPAKLRELGLSGPRDRRSRLSEEMRLVKRRLIQKMNPLASEAEGRTNLILVTSAVPGEGKSFISLNLALSFVADEHFDVLLIDADAMRPTILKMLGLPPARGLSDLLMHPEMDPSEVLLRDPALRLTILPPGEEAPSATDLYGGPHMKDLVRRLGRSQPNRIVILDAPPVLATTEPIMLAHIVDQVLMVVEADRTAHSAIRTALDLLEPCDNVSLILNKAVGSKSVEQFGSYYAPAPRGVPEEPMPEAAPPAAAPSPAPPPPPEPDEKA